MPPSVFPRADTSGPTGVRSRADNGSYLDNLGSRKIVTSDGVFRFGLADVTRPLLSAGEVVGRGHSIVMNQDGGAIILRNPAGRALRKIPLQRRGGVFTLRLEPRAADLRAPSPQPRDGAALMGRRSSAPAEVFQ